MPNDAATTVGSAQLDGMCERLLDAIGHVVVGQRAMLERLVIGLLANGHVLVEGVPGIAKTLAVTSLSQALNANFRRIQFTPDLLPADLIGTQIYRQQTGEFQVRKGPIFANLLLADEINRAPAKVQSALLEAMQEGQVTIGEESFRLPSPFLVLATQNPIEQEGTYPLPEAQVDRFMMKLSITYPRRDEEIEILERMSRTAPSMSIDPVASLDDIVAARASVDGIYVDQKVKEYIVDVVFATRDPVAAGLEVAAVHRIRRLSARHDFPDAGRQGARLRSWPRPRAAAGREGYRQGRDAPQDPHDLRSRGRRCHPGRPGPGGLRSRAGALSGPGSDRRRYARTRHAPTGSPDRNPRAPAGRRRLRRPLPEHL